MSEAEHVETTTRGTEHRVPLLGAGGWSLWRWFVLRGAGFEAATVLRLAVPDLERRLNVLEACETAHAAARVTAVESITEQMSVADDATRRLLSKLRRKITSGGALPPLVREADVALEELRRAADAVGAEQRALHAYLDEEIPKLGAAVREQASDDLFREALSWQNPNALRTGVDHLLRQAPGASNSQARQHEQLVASYLQRYCVKNDTIGFFGPIAWGSVTANASAPALEVRPGPALVARRTIYFEHWAVDVLARTLSEDPEIAVWAAPRRLPMVHVSEGRARIESGPAMPLTTAEAWLFAAADGETTAKDIAERLIREPLGVTSVQAAYELLRKLSARRLISWGLEIPTEVDHPEAVLETLLRRIGDDAVRDRATATLAELTTRRDAVAGAAGDPRRVGQALDELQAAFVRITGASATRRGGQTYAGRMLVYEDCVRSGEATLGPDLLRWLSSPVSALLTSARWFTHELAARYRALLGQIFREMQAGAATPDVELLRFLRIASPHFKHDPRNPPPIIRAVRQELARRWSEILSQQAEGSDPAAELESRVQAAFAAPGPGWPLARFHSPDLQLAAASVEVVQQGAFMAVLGELHVGCPTVLAPMMLRQHGDPDALLSARAIDVHPPCIAAVTGHETFDRSELTSRSGGDLHVELRDTRSWRPRSEVLAASDLVVGLRGEQLEVRTTDGSRRFDIIAFVERYLIALATREFHIRGPEAHAPRLQLGRLVVERETWRLDPLELEFAFLGSPTERFVGAARWAHRRGVPRHAFYKVPEEPKPCYIDFHSPLFVENFARSIRKASTVTMSEMLPGHDGLWLTDAAGRRYTCELRLVAVDPLAWSAPGG